MTRVFSLFTKRPESDYRCVQPRVAMDLSSAFHHAKAACLSPYTVESKSLAGLSLCCSQLKLTPFNLRNKIAKKYENIWGGRSPQKLGGLLPTLSELSSCYGII